MRTTLLDIAKLTGNDTVVGLVEENLKHTPELSIFPMRTIRGTSYTTGVRVGLPATGFRNANKGQQPSKSEWAQRLVQCYIFGGLVEVDKAVADAHEDGAAAFQILEANGVMRSALLSLGRQIWEGTVADDKGFPGLKAATPKGGTTINGDPIFIDATGASACSSVYAVSFGGQDVSLVGGRNTAFELGDWRIEHLDDGTGTGSKFEAYVAGLTSWIGLQLVSENSVRRIGNIADADGKRLTDALLARLLASFPVGYTPDAIFMSRRSRSQLQTSRTVVLQGQGRSRPDQPAIAPIPTEYDGIPIVVTDCIGNNDTAE